jgi:hypothetical protein
MRVEGAWQQKLVMVSFNMSLHLIGTAWLWMMSVKQLAACPHRRQSVVISNVCVPSHWWLIFACRFTMQIWPYK